MATTQNGRAASESSSEGMGGRKNGITQNSRHHAKPQPMGCIPAKVWQSHGTARAGPGDDNYGRHDSHCCRSSHLFIFFLGDFLFLLRAGQPGFIRRIRQCGVALFWPLYWLVVPGPLMALRLGSQLLSIVAFLMCLPVILAGFGLSYVFARLSLVGLAPRWMCEDQ